MSTKSEFLIDTEQSTNDPINTEHSVSNADPTIVPEVEGCASSGDSTSTFNTENFDQSLPSAEKAKQVSSQSGSIGAAADPVLQSSILLRKLSEAFGMSVFC